MDAEGTCEEDDGAGAGAGDAVGCCGCERVFEPAATRIVCSREVLRRRKVFDCACTVSSATVLGPAPGEEA